VNLSESASRDLFVAAQVACLGTVTEDGRPHLVPVTFAVERDRVYFAVDAKPKRTTRLKRLDNIRRHDVVSLLADHYDADWRRLWWVRADGTARILTQDDERAGPVELLSAKYPQYAQQAPQGPVVRIEVARWTGWRYSAEEL
jgi:PPOX class probable F420-dependent enzyme